ncbi:peptidyl-prolyl cis-trans isomerase Pin1 [Marasmius crinis-equi]|uniref:Peptidyl-prolyl cis-trans isomerase n=1 Tax=Marasmius crinis-equi TaxID=585013 RepID=A0ABR3FIC7_9AGAR
MGWEIRLSNSRGVPYYFNSETQQSVWEPPSELSPEQVQALPGAELLNSELPKSAAKSGQVRASHLLVKHNGSRRPSSWKEPNITRSKEEAISILKEYQAEIAGSPEKFADLARVHSDCSSHDKGGDLGWFGKGQMQKPFEDAAYGLEVGQMSDIISSDSGVHLVLRTG